MSVIIKSVQKHSPAHKAGIRAGDTLLKLNGNQIMDVLDYRFYQNDTTITADVLQKRGSIKQFTVQKTEEQELGLCFETYLMDKQRSCKNKCVFCFIDQMPKGLRESLYFKDDDSRLSFLFGNYITLTNITEHEIDRIIKMHISPINISVHTTNPALRVKMMKNKNAGEVLSIIDRLNNAGISMNCQLVLCPGYNDADELRRTLCDLTAKENIECIAAVPVGLTKHRDGLSPLVGFNKDSAEATLKILDEYGEKCLQKYGDRRVYGADEFYLLSGRDIPSADYYGDFKQLENGVGMWALFERDALDALDDCTAPKKTKNISCVTGVAAYPLISKTVDTAALKWHNLNCRVYCIKNDFFGDKITVAGLITGTDIINQLKGKDLGDMLIVPAVMLRHQGDMFLDNVTVKDLQKALGVKVIVVDSDGYSFIEALCH